MTTAPGPDEPPDEHDLASTLSNEELEDLIEHEDDLRPLGTKLKPSRFHPKMVAIGTTGLRAIVKMPSAFTTPRFHGYVVHHEVAAYRVDKVLRLGMVPVTVLRHFRDTGGRAVPVSVQLWKPSDEPATSPRALDSYLLRRAAAFDVLISNDDRHVDNYLTRLVPPGRQELHLIDNSLAFDTDLWVPRAGATLTARHHVLVNESQRVGGPDWSLFENVTTDELANAVDGLLEPEQVARLLERLEVYRRAA